MRGSHLRCARDVPVPVAVGGGGGSTDDVGSESPTAAGGGHRPPVLAPDRRRRSHPGRGPRWIRARRRSRSARPARPSGGGDSPGPLPSVWSRGRRSVSGDSDMAADDAHAAGRRRPDPAVRPSLGRRNSTRTMLLRFCQEPHDRIREAVLRMIPLTT